MQWRRSRKVQEAQEAYNPHINWTIEGHARALIENAKIKQDKIILKESLEEQLRQNISDTIKEKNDDIELGRQLCKLDIKQKNLENELIKFKKNAFTNELTDCWKKQKEFK